MPNQAKPRPAPQQLPAASPFKCRAGGPLCRLKGSRMLLVKVWYREACPAGRGGGGPPRQAVAEDDLSRESRAWPGSPRRDRRARCATQDYGGAGVPGGRLEGGEGGAGRAGARAGLARRAGVGSNGLVWFGALPTLYAMVHYRPMVVQPAWCQMPVKQKQVLRNGSMSPKLISALLPVFCVHLTCHGAMVWSPV